MSHLEKAVYDAAQAALLNSECHPRAAVQEALRATAEFAEGENAIPIMVHAGMDADRMERVLKAAFLRLAEVAWDTRKKD